MRLTVRRLRCIIREAMEDCWGGSHPDEMYEQQLMDDPAIAEKSVYVPDDVKHSIKKYFEKMGLSRSK